MLYTEELLEHYRHPQNYKRLKTATHKITLQNPLCGDVITLYIQVKGDIVQDASFEGTGCAIFTASASQLTEYFKGKSIEKLRKMDNESTMKVVGVTVSPGRLKCLLLPIEASKKALAR